MRKYESRTLCPSDGLRGPGRKWITLTHISRQRLSFATREGWRLSFARLQIVRLQQVHPYRPCPRQNISTSRTRMFVFIKELTGSCSEDTARERLHCVPVFVLPKWNIRKILLWNLADLTIE
jgi:hypothetical protein